MITLKVLVLMPLAIACSLLCINNQYDDLSQLILNSNLEGFKTAIADCSLTQGEKLGLRSLAEDISLKRLKMWERVHCFASNVMCMHYVPHTRSELTQTTIAGSLVFLSPLVLLGGVVSLAEALSEERIASSATAFYVMAAISGIMFCASISVAIKLIRSVGKGWSERANEFIRSIDELYTNSIKIRALLYGLA